MTMYIALLRGINVSGQKMIRMVELKQMFEELDLLQVQTYIQSGNVLFESNEEETGLRLRIQQEIERVFGFSVPVVLRTVQELERIIATCPFPVNDLPEGESVYVAHLQEAPSQEGIDRLLSYNNEVDELRIHGLDVYILYRQNAGRSKLTTTLIEKRLGVSATTRNWNTVNKLVEMSKQ
ncbi:MAG: DUF1697 domain-containing protein [Gorillibacterium sp.]|nr:DUF1697 domain-containing protein [Gorillibacterium sp.]